MLSFIYVFVALECGVWRSFLRFCLEVLKRLIGLAFLFKGLCNSVIIAIHSFHTQSMSNRTFFSKISEQSFRWFESFFFLMLAMNVNQKHHIQIGKKKSQGSNTNDIRFNVKRTKRKKLKSNKKNIYTYLRLNETTHSTRAQIQKVNTREMNKGTSDEFRHGSSNTTLVFAELWNDNTHYHAAIISIYYVYIEMENAQCAVFMFVRNWYSLVAATVRRTLTLYIHIKLYTYIIHICD